MSQSKAKCADEINPYLKEKFDELIEGAKNGQGIPEKDFRNRLELFSQKNGRDLRVELQEALDSYETMLANPELLKVDKDFVLKCRQKMTHLRNTFDDGAWTETQWLDAVVS